MALRRFAVFIAMMGACTFPAYAAPKPAHKPLAPRIEAGVRAGTERSIGVTEAWIPLAQSSDAVLYGDIRYMGDDDDNREGNIGVGYRKVVGNAVMGVHGWVDRRKTERGSIFHQVTVGGEMLGRDVDARVNVYVPVGGGKDYVTPVSGSTAPYLASTGIFYNGNGVLREEAQHGIDTEIGWRVPVWSDYADAIRVYGGGYSFRGDKTESVNGLRARVAVDINPAVRVGAVMQHDDARGDQAFLQATLRFPFSAKRSEREDDLYARLDESPERDIDIVTGAKQTDDGVCPVLNADTGQAQRVLHVDNTATPGGNGSKEHPYGTLADAQSAEKDYDIVYIHQGDGTVGGMNHGLTLQKNNVSVVGSGINFVYDAAKFSVANGGNYNGVILAAATGAPIVTNIDTDGNVATIEDGNGFYITGRNASIEGVNIDGATNSGVRANAPTGINLGTVTIGTMQATNNVQGPVNLVTPGGRIDTVTLSDITADHNGGSLLINGDTGHVGTVNANNITVNNTTAGAGGAFIIAGLTGIDTVNVSHITANNNNVAGILFQVPLAGGNFGTIRADHLTANNNSGNGVFVRLAGITGSIGSVDISDVTANGNGNNNGTMTANLSGVVVMLSGNATNRATMGSLTLNNITAFSNSQDGVSINNAGGILTTGQVSNVTAGLNTRYGVASIVSGAGTTTSLTLDRVTSGTNTQQGLFVQSTGAGSANTTSVDHGIFQNNMQNGILVNATANTTLAFRLQNSTITGNRQSGIYVNDDTTLSFAADIGGGTLGSVGRNTLFGNRVSAPATYGDVQVDLDLASDPAHGTLAAQNNYWGQTGGPVAGQVKSDASPNNGAVNSAGALSANPN